MKGFKDSSGKFHPITDYKGVRKSRDQSAKTKGVNIVNTKKIKGAREKYNQWYWDNLPTITRVHIIGDEIDLETSYLDLPPKQRKQVDVAFEQKRILDDVLEKGSKETIEALKNNKPSNIRFAKLLLEEYLQKKGFSDTGIHHHSTFLSPKGGFVGGGHKHMSHTDQLRKYLPKQKQYPYNPQGMIQKMSDEEEQLRKFTEDTGYVRVLNSTFLSQLRSRNDPHKLTFDINKKLTPQQIRSIRESEEEGNEITFSINRGKSGSGWSGIHGTGFRDLVREHAKIFGEES